MTWIGRPYSGCFARLAENTGMYINLAPTASQSYGRGLFGTPPVTWIGGPYSGWLGAARRTAFAPLALLSAGLDQPVRTLSGGASLARERMFIFSTCL